MYKTAKIKLNRKQWEKIGKTAGWIEGNSLSPEEIHKNMDDFMVNMQNQDPSAPDFAVDLRSKRIRIPPDLKRKAHKYLHSELGSRYHESIPNFVDELADMGIVCIQEDGTKWSGMISSQGDCGSDKANKEPIRIDLAVQNKFGGYQLATSQLIMTICTMHSGKLEIVAYIS